MRRVSAAGLAAALVLASAGAALAGGILHRGNGPEPVSLDPYRARSLSDMHVLHDIGEGLVAVSAAGAVVPGAAERWETSPDGKVYTFHLRADARWSNGDPVTAEDFVFSLRRAVDPATGAEYAALLGVIAGAEAIRSGQETDLATLGVAARDLRTVTVTLARPAPYLPQILAMPVAFPVHRPTLEAFGDRFMRPDHAVGNGAFVLAEWVPQSHVAVVRNPNFHHAGAVALDRVVFHATEDPAAELRRFRAGALDVTYEVPADQIPWIERNLAGAYRATPVLATYFYGINLGRAPLGAHPGLRRALSLAIDREALVAKVTRGGERPALGRVPPGMPGYVPADPPWARLTRAEREAEARRLFAESGYGPGRPLRLTLLYNTNENHRRTAIAVAGMWRQVLGEVEFAHDTREGRVYVQNRRQRDFELARASWFADLADPANFLDMFESAAGPRNEWGYANPRFDALLREAGTEPDAARRLALLREAEAVLLEDPPFIPLFHHTARHLVSDRVKGWADNALDLHPSRHLSVE